MIDLVVPTVGRPTLQRLLASLARAHGPRPNQIVVVDDRAQRGTPLPVGRHDADFQDRLRIVNTGGRGPAAARNAGWRASRATWIGFLDDDVEVEAQWLAALHDDIRGLRPDVAGSTGSVSVPLPKNRKPTDWERNVAALEGALYITADCAYRRTTLLAVGGFDERFTRAYREDADLALRIFTRGNRIVSGRRSVIHPVRPAPWSISVTLQRGNADDVLMRALHGRDWRRRVGAPPGTFAAHVGTVAAASLGVAAGLLCRAKSRNRCRVFAVVCTAAWAAQTSAFAYRRIAPGPLTLGEVTALLATSVAVPFAAVYHHVRGRLRARALLADAARAPHPIAPAVLFDRDGTLIVDVPYNADPARVVPTPTAQRALQRLRDAGVLTAVVSNQRGVALGKIREADVAAINARAEALLGPLGPTFACIHADDAGCACRKPAPGLIREAAERLGVDPRDCVVIGDIGADVKAARAAGARAILVPTTATRREEIAAAPFVAADLDAAVSAILNASLPQQDAVPGTAIERTDAAMAVGAAA